MDPVIHVHVRPAEPRDLPALGRLGGQLVRTHHAFDRDRFIAPDADVEDGYAWFLGTQLGQKDVVIYVAEVEGAVVGYVYAGMEPHSWKELRDRAGFIQDLLVDPSYRGRGIGSQLLDAGATWLEDRGAPRVMLWTAEQNPAAQRLFERAGFRRTMVEMTRERR